MVDDYSPLIYGIIGGVVGAFLTLIVNYITYMSTTQKDIKKENNIKYIKEQLTDLIVPLFFIFRNIENEHISYIAWGGFPNNLRDPEAFIDELISNNEIETILKHKLYLASPELFDLLSDFIKLQYAYDRDEFDKMENSEYIVDTYRKLKEAIYEEYEEKTTLYKNYFDS